MSLPSSTSRRLALPLHLLSRPQASLHHPTSSFISAPLDAESIHVMSLVLLRQGPSSPDPTSPSPKSAGCPMWFHNPETASPQPCSISLKDHYAWLIRFVHLARAPQEFCGQVSSCSQSTLTWGRGSYSLADEVTFHTHTHTHVKVPVDKYRAH